ncbi:MAG: superoxide dismutase [Candidatus Limnocylindria bacterium]
MRSITALLVLLIALVASPAGAADRPFPDVIQLPNGFRPEGIAVGTGTTFFTGSLGGLGVYRGDLRTGEGATFIPGNGRTFVGMKVDATGRLWIAGGGTGSGYAFDATTGEELASFQFASAPTFVNDVIVTKDAAWFTESLRPTLYRVAIGPNGAIGTAAPVDLTGKIEFVAGFNLNGIAATPDGSMLITVNSTTGKLYAIDTETIATHEIDLGGATVTTGDGILLHGQALYVVRNRMNQIAVVELPPDLSSGTVVDVITSAAFDVPTTITRHGGALYAVNARFTTPPTPTTEYTAVGVGR